MAICFLETKSINRASGQSAVASASYRSGDKLTDERIGKTFDYGKKGGILSTNIITPTGMDDGIDRGELWNKAEQAEKRKDGRTAREILVNIPHELMSLNHELGGELVRQFAQSLADDFGVGIDVAIHAPSKQGDERNYHAHLLMTTRKINVADGVILLGDKAQLELSDTKLKKLNLPRSKDTLDRIKETWATLTNEHLKANGIAETIDHRSHADRGLDTLPQIKMGHTATALERKGIRTTKGDINRAVRKHNTLARQRAKALAEQEQAEWEYGSQLSAQYRDDLVLVPSIDIDIERYKKEQAEWEQANAHKWDKAYERYKRQQAEQERQERERQEREHKEYIAQLEAQRQAEWEREAQRQALAQWERANAHHKDTAIQLFRGQIGVINSIDPTPLQGQKLFATARVLGACKDRQGLAEYIARTNDSDIQRHRQALEQVSQEKQLYRQSSVSSTDPTGYPFRHLSNAYNSSTPPEPLKTSFDSVQAVLLGAEWRERLNPHRTTQNALQDDLAHEQGQENKPPAPKI